MEAEVGAQTPRGWVRRETVGGGGLRSWEVFWGAGFAWPQRLDP